VSLVQEDGEQMGRFKVRGLMRELDLVSKQSGSHVYKHAMVERPDIPNILNREFDVPAPNQVWCGDLHPGSREMALPGGRYGSLRARVVGWRCRTSRMRMVIKALDMAYEQCGRPQGLLFHSDQGSQGGFNRSSQHWISPHQFNKGLAPAQAEKKLNVVSGIS
jgi:putative transposase